MNYVVTYREPNGRRAEIQVEASDRAEAFAQLKERGIAAISIREGTLTPPSRSPKMPHLIAAATVLVLVGAIVLMVLRPSEKRMSARPETPPTAKIAEVKPARATKMGGETVEDEEKSEKARRAEAFKDMSKEEKIVYLRERMKALPLPAEPKSNRLYRTGVEQVMDWIFTCEVGAPPPILPNLPQYERLHLAEILISDNPVKEGDSERAAAAKKLVEQAKKEFRDFIKEGGEPEDFLPYYHGQLVAAHEEWKMARNEVFETVRNDPAIALDFAKKVNEKLTAKGIKNVVIPEKMMEKFGIKPED